MDIKIKIVNKHCIVEGDPVIVCGNKAGYTMTFTFDEEWVHTGPKTARFSWLQKGARVYRDVDLVGDTVTVPAVYKTEELRVGVYAEGLESTAPGRVRCVKSILCDTCTPSEFEAGKQAEYDAFWDVYQDNGKRLQYQRAFCGPGWTDTIFKPKYDLILYAGYTGKEMFWGSRISNIAESLEKLGVRLDTTLCGHMESMFNSSLTERIPELNCTHATDYGFGLHYTFFNATAKTIDKLIVPENLTYISTFYGCSNLENITFEGTIGNSISFANSPLLTIESVQSVIDHLKDLTGATAQTLTFHATVGGKLTDAQKATITAKNWTLVY